MAAGKRIPAGRSGHNAAVEEVRSLDTDWLTGLLDLETYLDDLHDPKAAPKCNWNPSSEQSA